MHNTGQCHCGQIKFTVEGEPLRMAQCHCNACRRISGTGHAVNVFFKTSQVSITGETKKYEMTADSGNTRYRHFCPNCGSRMFSAGPNNPEITGIAAGVFDNSDWFKPNMIVYHAERPVWDVVDPEIATHEAMPK